MAEVKLNRVLIGPDGEPMTKQGTNDTWSVKEVIMFALKHGKLERQTMEAVIERCDLATRLKAADKTMCFDVDEAKTIQDCALAIFGPFTTGPLSELLAGSGENEKPKKKGK